MTNGDPCKASLNRAIYKKGVEHMEKIKLYTILGLIAIILIAIPTDLFASDNIVNFADANFEEVVREMLGKPSGDIYVSEVDSISSIEAAQCDISDLSGIEHFKALRSLDIYNNYISDLTPLSKLTSLQDLILTRNFVSDIKPLASVNSLRYVSLSANPISDISPLTSMTFLDSLYLNECGLTNIEVISALTSIKELGLEVNNISDISPLSNLTSLNYITLDKNPINDISALSNLTSLRSLYLSNTGIYSIEPLSKLTRLENLGLLNNNISDISPLKGMTSLRWLGLLDNNIDFSDGSPNLSIIETLKTHRTEIDYIRQKSAETVSEPVPQPDKGEPVTFGDANLEIAVRSFISKPSGSIYPSDVSMLTNLYGVGLGITDLSGLEHLKALQILELPENQIQDISLLSGLKDLQILNLSGNRIKDLSPISSLNSLNELSLDNCGLSDISGLYGLGALKKLSLRGNDINDVSPLGSFKQLESLDLTGNNISDINGLAQADNLKTLILTDNNIEDISALALMDKLEFVHLQDNYIQIGGGGNSLAIIDALSSKDCYVEYSEQKKRLENATPNVVVPNETIPIYTVPQEQKGQIILTIGNPWMTVNGALREVDSGRGTAPILKDSRTLLPIRSIIEAMGGSVEWDNSERKITLYVKQQIIQLWLEDKTAKINGTPYEMDVPAQSINDRTFIPLRFVAENLGCNVLWEASTQTIKVEY